MHWTPTQSSGEENWSTIIIKSILPAGTLIHKPLHEKLTLPASLGSFALDVVRTGARMLFCDCTM
jgi:hypothetical protein